MQRAFNKFTYLISTGNLVNRGILWIKYKRKLLVYRFLFIFRMLSYPKDIGEPDTQFEDPHMALPGDKEFIDMMFLKQTKYPKKEYKFIFEQAISHHAIILSHHISNLGENAQPLPDLFYELTKELPDSFVSSYKPINWQRDFTSGKEWVGGHLFFDNINSPKPGSDIKVPWELSRFVHIGSLSYGDREEAGHEFLLQVADWISTNPDYTGINWSSELIVSIRAVNWIWAISLYKPVIIKYPRLAERVIRSIYEHRLYLEKNMAFYPSTTDDHYLSNLVAIGYISLAFPRFPDSDKWLLFSYQQICSEMKRQVHDDGLSYMMSTGYHRFVTELFCSVVSFFEKMPEERRKRLNLLKKLTIKPSPDTMMPYGASYLIPATGTIFPEWFYRKLAQMGNAINILTKPDGRITQIGDNDSARVHKLRPLLFYDTRKHLQTASLVSSLCNFHLDNLLLENEDWEETELLTRGLTSKSSFIRVDEILEKFGNIYLLKQSQIAVYKTSNLYVAMLCPPNGYNGLGGHGHNDKCSFELNISGFDFFVDAGCPFYTSDVKQRNAYRSVRAHTTFIVDDIEQDPIDEFEIFSLKQERSNPILRIDSANQVFSSHDGFGVTCSRSYTFLPNWLKIVDKVPIKALCKKIQFNLHPDVNIVSIEKESDTHIVVLKNHEIVIKLFIKNSDGWEKRKGVYGTGYGQSVETQLLQFEFSGETIETLINY